VDRSAQGGRVPGYLQNPEVLRALTRIIRESSNECRLPLDQRRRTEDGILILPALEFCELLKSGELL
jgi:hypothetical protein